MTAVAFAVALGFGIVAPALPIFAKRFGVGETAAAAVISAFAFMRFVSALGSGRLVDRVGERVMLVAGIGIVAVSSVLAGLSQSYVQLIVLRGVGGVGSAMFTVSAVNLVLRVAGPERRGRASGAFQSGFILGGIAGPALGGALIAFSIRTPFFVYAGTLAVAGAIALLFLEGTQRRGIPDAGPAPGPASVSTPVEGASGAASDHASTPDDHTHTSGPADPPERVTLARALRNSAYRTALTANLGVGWVLFGMRAALIPLFVKAALGQDPLWIGVGFAITSGVQALTLLVAGRLVDTYGRRPGMVGGAVLATASMVMLTLSSALPLYLAATAVLGAGASFLTVGTAGVVGDVAGGRSGTVAAAYQMSRDLGVIVGPLVAGALAQSLSYGAAFGVSAAIMAAIAVLAGVSRETRTVAR